jgi:hypothetical protein
MRLKTKVKLALQNWRIQRTLEPLERGGMTRQEMAAFRHAFSNEGFSADVDCLLALQWELKGGAVLECGTGATTLIAERIGAKEGFRTYSLEQDPEWSEYVRRFLLGTDAVQVIDAVLTDRGDHFWYDAPNDLPQHFSLVICDGPAVYDVPEPHLSGWRYGVLPWLEDTGRTFDVLLLDDTNEPRGQPLLARWQKDFGVSAEVVQAGNGSYAIVRPARGGTVPPH